MPRLGPARLALRALAGEDVSACRMRGVLLPWRMFWSPAVGQNERPDNGRQPAQQSREGRRPPHPRGVDQSARRYSE